MHCPVLPYLVCMCTEQLVLSTSKSAGLFGSAGCGGKGVKGKFNDSLTVLLFF